MVEYEELEVEMEDLTDVEEPEDLEEEDGLSEELRQALLKSPEMRTWQETEMVELYRNPRYTPQQGYATDLETGEALRDENGDLVHCTRRTRGSQVPDGMYEDEDGICILELKNIDDAKKLRDDITSQTVDRMDALGEDLKEIRFVASPHFTVGEAEQLQNYCQKYLRKWGNVELEFQMK